MTDLMEDYLFLWSDTDEEESVSAGSDCVGPDVGLHELHYKYEHMNLRTYDHTEHKTYEIENDIDPNYYNNINCNCEYYTDEQFKINVTMDGSVSNSFQQ